MEPAHRDLVVALLRQFAEIVEKKQGCLPLSKTEEAHDINTGSSAPIMLRRRRHAVAGNETIDKEVAEMLNMGWLKKDKSRGGSGGVGAQEGRQRTILYRLSGPQCCHHQGCLSAAESGRNDGGITWISKLHQLGFAKGDREKTPFATRWELFQVLRMPFGLCNPPSTFQRLMNCVLRGLAWVCCLVNLDDERHGGAACCGVGGGVRKAC
ncbi:unnamed protein product [Phytophthora fragariaefolia]|uniref:Unnamed protein product n=1 Tax=Phytophthora fragariaefolia TaxID=1490495 RepID=A0A9W6XBA5_9STRA|nr:unnamed protein product [Phytophthora fragariaefolia]